MKKAVICFTRVPRPGTTKTRLLPILCGEQCAALHTAFLHDIAAVYEGLEAELFVAYTPDPDWHMLKGIFPLAKGFFPQEGGDLGAKMLNAISHVLGLGYEAVILTGTDLPTLTVEHFRGGFAALEQADVAIGPTSDGGYYLIGMKKPHAAPFSGQSYGGSTVYENTMAAIRSAGLTAATAPLCDDADTPEDLAELAKHIDPDRHTGRCIHDFRKAGVFI